MTQKHLILKNGMIIGEIDKRYDEFMHILWKNLPYISNNQVDLRDLSFAPTSAKTKQCAHLSMSATIVDTSFSIYFELVEVTCQTEANLGNLGNQKLLELDKMEPEIAPIIYF